MISDESWERVLWTGVGGVLAVGIPDETRVVIGSHSGVGVFNTFSGERTARLVDNDYGWWDEEHLAVLLPSSEGVETVPSMGLWGGSLPVLTADGWRCSRVQDGVVVTSGDERLSVTDDEESRAFGFSPVGTVFVLATSPSLQVWRRRR